jgi:hypothetical protein
MTVLSFESSPRAHTQIILRYFAIFYVLGLLRGFMSDVFPAQESELAISRETLRRFSLYIVTPHLRPSSDTYFDTRVWMWLISFCFVGI